MDKKRKKSGFTLMEMLIVVAIIAVLVAVAIPTFAGSVEKARKAACAANRRALYAELSVSYMLEDYAPPIDTTIEPTAEQAEKYVCPSGGKITYTFNGSQFKVRCSIHDPDGNEGGGGDEPNPGEDAEKKFSGSADIIKNAFDSVFGSELSSTGNGNNAATAKYFIDEETGYCIAYCATAGGNGNNSSLKNQLKKDTGKDVIILVTNGNDSNDDRTALKNYLAAKGTNVDSVDKVAFYENGTVKSVTVTIGSVQKTIEYNNG